MDTENKGYIEIEMMKTFLMKEGFWRIYFSFIEFFFVKRIEFDEAATDAFIKFATNGDAKFYLLYILIGFNVIVFWSATLIYYEDYISRLSSYVDKHMENLWRGFNNYQVPKK